MPYLQSNRPYMWVYRYPAQNGENTPTPMIRNKNLTTHNIHMQMSQLAIQKQKENQITLPEDTTYNTTAAETTDNTYTHINRGRKYSIC
jgi:hypothetical protein